MLDLGNHGTGLEHRMHGVLCVIGVYNMSCMLCELCDHMLYVLCELGA